MTKTYKISDNEEHGQKGFVLIVAIFAIMILTAIGIFALTTASSDIRISVRQVSEANALSAAEAGVHFSSVNFNPGEAVALPDIPTTNVLSPVGTFNSSYTIVGQNRNHDTVPCDGGDLTKKYGYYIYDARVTGFDNRLGGRVPLDVGITDGVCRSAEQ